MPCAHEMSAGTLLFACQHMAKMRRVRLARLDFLFWLDRKPEPAPQLASGSAKLVGNWGSHTLMRSGNRRAERAIGIFARLAGVDRDRAYAADP